MEDGRATIFLVDIFEDRFRPATSQSVVYCMVIRKSRSLRRDI